MPECSRLLILMLSKQQLRNKRVHKRKYICFRYTAQSCVHAQCLLDGHLFDEGVKLGTVAEALLDL